MHVTFFQSKSGSKKTTADLTLEELQVLILKTTATDKFKLPWLKLARFGDVASQNHSYRYNANVLAISGVELDYDKKVFPVSTAVEILTHRHVRSLVYTSPTHAADRFKWRVLAPTSRELGPEQRTPMAARINGIFGGIFSRESFTLSQAYFYGKVNDNPLHAAHVIDGDYIDVRPDLDGGRIVPTGRERLRTNGLLQDGRDVDPELVRHAMAIIPNEDLDWPTWNRMGMALWSALKGSHFEIFDEWSQKYSGYDAAATRARWDAYSSCPPTDLGIGTIIYEANGINPWWRNAYDDDVERRIMEANRRDQAS